MSIEWILGMLLAAQAGLLSFYIHHIIACNRRDQTRADENLLINTKLATITETLRRVEVDIGTHETGIRGELHQLIKDVSPYIVREQKRRVE